MILQQFRQALFFLLFTSTTASFASPSPSPSPSASPVGDFPIKDTMEASVYRGSIAYQNYCVLCHGITAEGNGRAAKMYTPPPFNLRRSMMSDSYKEQIIRKGGKALGRSEFMPPWAQELTDEQVTDLVNFLRTIAPVEASSVKAAKSSSGH